MAIPSGLVMATAVLSLCAFGGMFSGMAAFSETKKLRYTHFRHSRPVHAKVGVLSSFFSLVFLSGVMMLSLHFFQQLSWKCVVSSFKTVLKFLNWGKGFNKGTLVALHKWDASKVSDQSEHCWNSSWIELEKVVKREFLSFPDGYKRRKLRKWIPASKK